MTLRIKWINENTEGGWATAGGPNWREKEQHQKLMAEIDRLEKESLYAGND